MNIVYLVLAVVFLIGGATGLAIGTYYAVDDSGSGSSRDPDQPTVTPDPEPTVTPDPDPEDPIPDPMIAWYGCASGITPAQRDCSGPPGANAEVAFYGFSAPSSQIAACGDPIPGMMNFFCIGGAGGSAANVIDPGQDPGYFSNKVRFPSLAPYARTLLVSLTLTLSRCSRRTPTKCLPTCTRPAGTVL